MANTFFGFNTALNDHSERLGSSPEDIEGLEAEEEYDALNDETFGALEVEGDFEDWEAQHEQLAEIAESSRYSSDIESFLDNLDLEDFAYVNNYNKKEKRKNSLLENSIKSLPNDSPSKSSQSPDFFNNHHQLHQQQLHQQQQQQQQQNAGVGRLQNIQNLQNFGASPRQQGPKLQTVEELERMLLNQAKPPPPNFHHQVPPRFPPGFHMLPNNTPMWPQQNPGVPGGPVGPGGPGGPPGMPPPGMMRMMGPPPHGRMPPPPPPHMMGPGPPPGFMYGHHPNSGFPMNPHFNFPPPPQLMPPPPRNNQYPPGNMKTPHPPQQQQMYQQQQHQQHSNNHRNSHQGGEAKDEYAGLMNNREKQWLLNIQLLQVNTGTPYFDDYYYTVFKERQSKNKENQPEQNKMNNQRYHNNRYQQHGGHGHSHGHGHARDGNVGHHRSPQDNNRQQQQQDSTQNPLNKKVYIPLQFENSLGKLQFGSVTAPRKIIDMDIITLEKDSENSNNSRDSRKTKQLLLELEALYTLILKAEDLKNPIAIQNTEKLIELKQKQRLREIDVAQTPEQKQEILKLLQQESVAPVENQSEILGRIMSALLQDDKLQSFLGIRKGKMMLLRVLPHLPIDTYSIQLTEIWQKLFLSIPVIGRRDTIGDNILPRFYTLFKRFINGINMDQILDLVLTLIEIIKLENNSRSTPLSHQSKLPLHFILQNKFGVSAISSLLQRVDTLLVETTDKQQFDWSNFMSSLVDTLSLVGAGMVTPIEPISEQILSRHVEKVGGLSFDKRQLLEKTFVDF